MAETPIDDRLRAALEGLVRSMMPPVQYLGYYEYVVVGYSTGNQTADLRSLNDSMPDIQRLPIRTPGLELDLPNGTSVLVGFRNGDLTKPYVGFFDAPGGGQFPTRIQVKGTTRTELGPNPVLPACRQGDMVVSAGFGTQVMFAIGPDPLGDTVPVPTPMMTNTPYLISFGSVLGIPPSFPKQVPALPVGQLYGLTSSGSPFVFECLPLLIWFGLSMLRAAGVA